MMRLPAFSPRFHVEVVPGEGVFLLGEGVHHLLERKWFERVAPLVDGRNTVDDIVEGLEGTLSAAAVYYTLTMLGQRGLLQDTDTDYFRPASQAVEASTTDHSSSADPDRRVGVAALGGVSAEPMRAALRALGIGSGSDGLLQVVLTDDYLRSGLEEYNRVALRENRLWLLIKPVGREVFIGPLFVPGRSGCWCCLRERHLLHRAADCYVMIRKGRDDPFPLPMAHTPATVQIACSIAAQEIFRWFGSDEQKLLEGRVVSMDTCTWQAKSHFLL